MSYGFQLVCLSLGHLRNVGYTITCKRKRWEIWVFKY
uniref:Uncharacterized protein n=1 Tax=Rhizophora mucronata TaxID=61149 RepID=A0A2P2QHV9_RHIMU